MMKPARLALLVFLAGTAAHACERFLTAGGRPYYRADYANVSIRVNQAVAAGMVNSAGSAMITADSDPLAAIAAALETWSSVPGSAVRFAPPAVTAAAYDPGDGHNVVVFADTPEIRSVVGDALAVTVNMVRDDGRIVDSDTLFSPAYTFSTTLAPGTYDLQSVETHELGHVLGANHSTVLSATMFQSVASGEDIESALSADDVAFAAAAYPDGTNGLGFGQISGHVRLGGAPVKGASVAAVDASAGVAVASLSRSDGSFTIAHLPPGSYLVYAEPLTGPVLAANLYIPDSYLDTSFSAAFLGSADSPRAVQVAAGGAAAVDLAVRGPCNLHIDAIGTGAAAGSGDFTGFADGPIHVVPGESFDLLLRGAGIDRSVLNGIRLLGPGLAIRPGSARLDSGLEINGQPLVRVTVDVAPRSTIAVATVVVIKGGDAATYTGGIVVAPPKPSFASANLVNAASFTGGGVAPGEIASLFGSGLGPGPGVENSGLDPATDRMATRLGGVTVTFDGIPAPLFYVSATQINLQVPYEVAGKSSALVAVEYNGRASPAAEIPVKASAPGMFTLSRSLQAIAVNQDSSVNSPSSPAARGSIVTLFATGQGVTNPAVPTGALATASPPAFVHNVLVHIGGQIAKLRFAGLAPGLAGLMQVNVEVPAGATSGNAVPVQLSVGGASAPVATIAVK